MELVSIVIPVYNIEKYLRKCIDSLIFQTYRNIEIVLVDDGSTDGSTKLCDDMALQDERIIVIHKENGGVSSARNCGIEAAKGAYITFVDGDDWVEAIYIETLYESIKKYNADISAAGFIYQYEDGKSKPIRITAETVCISAENALDQVCDPVKPWVGFACGKLVRKSLLSENGIKFDASIKICEDSLFWYTIIEKASFVVKNEKPMYHYRIRESSATRTSRKSLTVLITKITAFEKAMIIADRHPGTTFQHRVQGTLFSDIISYISAMFALQQYDKTEIETLRTKLNQIRNPDVMCILRKGVKIRYYIFALSPRLLYCVEQIVSVARGMRCLNAE